MLVTVHKRIVSYSVYLKLQYFIFVVVVWHYPREPLDEVLHSLYHLALVFDCVLVLYH